jgi:uncharacterized membrane protein YoaK (UPF0700 family)
MRWAQMKKDVLTDLVLALALLAVAGFVDAVGFLTLGGLFVSFASGNSTQFAISLGGVRAGPGLQAGMLVGFFVVGVTGGRILAIAAGDWRRPAILVAVAALLAASALAPLSAPRSGLLMALAMGAQNGIVHKAGETRTALTYVTGTLVNFGEKLAEALTSAGPPFAWAPYLLLWAGLVVGGAAGGVAFGSLGLRALLFPAAAALVLAVAAAWPRKPA